MTEKMPKKPAGVAIMMALKKRGESDMEEEKKELASGSLYSLAEKIDAMEEGKERDVLIAKMSKILDGMKSA